ncbi:hypothetical protein FRB94_012427 [Tulasnella sp. JGI-2019a]|nr:hypothetical protein FRB94_012427 [Tulasnella sp. JGI-2019a]
MNPPSTSYSSPSGIQIQVSATFSPNTVLPASRGAPVDIIIRTSDFVFFYANQTVLRARSSNLFGKLLPDTASAQSSAPSGSRHMFSDHLMDMPSLSDSTSSSSPPPPQQARYPSFNRTDSMPPQHPTYHSPPPRRESGQSQREPLLSIAVDEHAVVFNIIMHITYEMDCDRYGPDLSTLSHALGALWKYGIPIPGAQSDVWRILIHHSQSQPLWAYAISAQYGMDFACIPASRNTLAVPLSTLGEAEAQTMGAIYLRRLFFLHVGRRTALQRVIINPPQTHPTSNACSTEMQLSISNAWAVTVADVVTRPLAPSTPVATLLEMFRPIEQLTVCRTCKTSIRARISEMVQNWLNIKSTI